MGSWVQAEDATWGWGPWMRLLATSKGIFTQEAMVPAISPNTNYDKTKHPELAINVII